jgi:hypothetical protein
MSPECLEKICHKIGGNAGGRKNLMFLHNIEVFRKFFRENIKSHVIFAILEIYGRFSRKCSQKLKKAFLFNI